MATSIDDDDDKGLAVVRDDNWDDEQDDQVADDWDAPEDNQPVSKVATAKTKPAASTGTKREKALPSSKSTLQGAVPPGTTTAPSHQETDAERRARLEKIVQERDLESAMELFGISGSSKTSSSGIAASVTGASTSNDTFETFTPTTTVEFEQYSRMISRRLEMLAESRQYPGFLEHLINTLMSKRDVTEIRKVAGVLSDMAVTKQREKVAAAQQLQQQQQQQQSSISSSNSNSSASKKAPAMISLKATKASKGSSGRFDDCFDYRGDDPFDD